jgi:hypothetical protein
MRKHNTVKESSVTRKKANRKLTVGIDLGDRSSRYCILDQQGEVLAEGSMATTKERLCPGIGIETAEPSGAGSGHALSLGKSIPSGSGP